MISEYTNVLCSQNRSKTAQPMAKNTTIKVPPPKGRRTKSKTTALNEKIAEKLSQTGDLPHEWLAKVARGECIMQRKLVVVYYKSGPKAGAEKERRWEEEEYYASFAERMDAAKASAPYFAPRLASQTVQPGGEAGQMLKDAFATLAERLPV